MMQQTVAEFGTCPITDGKLPKVNQLPVEFAVDKKLPFCIVDQLSFHCFVDVPQPFASSKPPCCTKVKGLVSKHATPVLKKVDEETWENVSKEHVDGVIACTGGHAFAIETNKAGCKHNGLATACEWEQLIMMHFLKYPIVHM